MLIGLVKEVYDGLGVGLVIATVGDIVSEAAEYEGIHRNEKQNRRSCLKTNYTVFYLK